MEKSINGLIEQSIKKHWEEMALTDMGGVNYQYKDVAQLIEQLHIIFEKGGITRGDHVAICGKNSANWAVVFLACLTSGVVAVPILHEFKPETIHHLVNHSEAKMLFTDQAIWENLDEASMPDIEAVVYISEFGMPVCRNQAFCDARAHINELFGQKHPYSFKPEDVNYVEVDPDAMAVINYTSGSTGMSKGVMAPYRALYSNVLFGHEEINFLKPGDGMVNMLPLAHMYGMIIEMLYPFTAGCHLHFLTRVPSPKIILGAFAQVKPKLVITVPLILEKIVKNKIFPMLEKPLMKVLLKVPFLDDRLLAKIRKGLLDAFGGNLVEIIIGGAALNADVEKFLKRIDFPYTVGYGMTECAPLISYTWWKDCKFHSVGKTVQRMEIKVDSPDGQNIPGDLWVRGENVMLGYYKNEKATKEVMMGDGWMNTGDMCVVDENGFITICGRTKTMILGPSGQNIYPEEIEQKLDNLPYVSESLVIEDAGKLVALIYPDFENATKMGLTTEDIDKQMAENIKTLNTIVPAYSKVSRYKIFEEEFEKTPKRSIKRFLYQPK